MLLTKWPAKIWLRTASVLTLAHALLHTAGGVLGPTPPGTAQTVAEAMRHGSFSAMGVTRTFWDFHIGFGLGLSIFLFAEGVIFWQMSNLAANSGAALRPLLMTFLLAYVVLSVVSLRYFFLAPVVVELAIAACLGGAMARVAPRARASLVNA